MIIKLSRKIQRESLPILLRFNTINAIGVGFTQGYVISLLALYYGASDTQISIIYSAIFISSIASLLAPQFLNGKETTKIWRICWWTRSILSLSYLFIPFLPNNQIKITALTIIYFMFLAVRAIGTSAIFVAQKAICPPAKMQELSGKLFIRVNIALLLTGAFSFLILDKAGLPSQELAFMILIGIGVIANFAASISIRNLTKTGYVEGGGFNGLIDAFRVIIKNIHYRETLWLTMLITGQVICSSFIINYLRNIAGYSSGLVLAITSAGFLAGAIASYFITITGNHITHKAFYFIANFMLIIISLLWSLIKLIPTGNSIITPLILFALTSFSLTLNGSVLYRLQTARLPETNSYQVSIIYQLSAVLASLLTIATLHFTSEYNIMATISFFHTYSTTFLLWTILSITTCILSIKMRSEQQVTMKSELSSLSPSNILDIFRYHRTSMMKQETARKLRIDTLMQSSTPIAKKLALEWLNSPDIEKRVRAFLSLNRHPYPEAFDAVLAEATAPASPLQSEAITTLGILKNKKAIIPLKKMLSKSTDTAKAYIIKTLLRLDEKIDDDTILNIYWQTTYSGNRLNILLGVSETKRKKLITTILIKELQQKPTIIWTQTLLLYAAQAFNFKETLIDIFKEEKEEPGKGLEYILEETKESTLAKLDIETVKTVFNKSQYSELYKAEKVYNENSILKYAFDASSFLGLILLWIIQQENKDQ